MEKPESVDSLVAKHLSVALITKESVISNIARIGNPFSILDYLTKLRTYLEVGIENSGVIKAEPGLTSLLSELEQKAIQVARQKAERDDLTGLYNSGKIKDNMRILTEKYAVLMLDIDRFKRINDTYGHLVGDLVIKNVARIMQQNLRESFVGRYGGEEFYVELNQTDKEGARVAAERIRKAVEEKTIDYIIEDLGRMKLEIPEKLKKERITLSVGVADEQQGKTPYDVRNKADRALYKAKQYGRNIVIFDGQDPFKNLGLGKRILFYTTYLMEKLGKCIVNLSDGIRRYTR